MKIAICDNDLNSANVLKNYVYFFANKYRIEPVLDIFCSGEELLEDFSEYQLFFIDYPLCGMNGLDVARKIRKSLPHCTIVFLNESVDFIIKAMEVTPFRFIGKPIKEKQLFDMLTSFFFCPSPTRPLWIKSGSDTFCCQAGDIYYLEADNKYCTICFENKKISCHKTMSTVYDVLPKNRFCKINRAYIVNFDYIKAYNREYVILINGELLHISKNYYSSFKKEYRCFARPLEL